MNPDAPKYTQEQKERFAVEDAVRAHGEQIENNAQGPTTEQMRAALKDDSTPLAVKRIIRNHLFGRIEGRREIGHELRHSAGYRLMEVPSGARLKANKLQKPAGMSGRQFKRLRKEVVREMNRAQRER